MASEREELDKLIQERPELAAMLRHRQKVLENAATDPEPMFVAASEDHGNIEGSKQVQCACGTRVWISPSTQEMMTKRGAYPTSVLCPSCFMLCVLSELFPTC
jgi:hypothetical protein